MDIEELRLLCQLHVSINSSIVSTSRGCFLPLSWLWNSRQASDTIITMRSGSFIPTSRRPTKYINCVSGRGRRTPKTSLYSVQS